MDEEMTEVHIIIKDEDSTYRQKFISYDPITVSSSNKTLREFLKEALENVKKEPEDIEIRTIFKWNDKLP